MRRWLLALLAALAAGPVLGEDAGALAGEARALASETVAIKGTRFRFAGVAAPSADARCGDAACADAATRRLAELVATGPVTCSRDARLGHGVYLGTCRLADGRDLARVLAGEGLLRPAR